MAENYFYSSLTGQQIEDRLVGGVVFNYAQDLTTSQKARARENIGAGEGSTSFKIMGYFATLDDLREYLQMLPEPGDAYGISETPTPASEYLSPDGTQRSFTLSESPYALKITYVPTMTVLVRNTDYTYADSVVTFPTAPASGTDTYLVEWGDPVAPYDVYVWDGVSNTWVNNGTLFADSLIDDNDITAETTWSSLKISTELSGKQNTLTFDNVPTDDSSNPVKSGGVYDAIEEAKALYLTGVSVSIGTNTTIATISNAAITADHVVVSCIFANPSAITDVTWTTGAGTLTLTGTCTAATTANIILVVKGN